MRRDDPRIVSAVPLAVVTVVRRRFTYDRVLAPGNREIGMIGDAGVYDADGDTPARRGGDIGIDVPQLVDVREIDRAQRERHAVLEGEAALEQTPEAALRIDVEAGDLLRTLPPRERDSAHGNPRGPPGGPGCRIGEGDPPRTGAGTTARIGEHLHGQ